VTKPLRHIALILAALALSLAIPATAAADWTDVIRDCNEDGDLDRNYSDEDLRKAEDNLPSDIDEYTDCRDVIRNARLGRRSRGGAGGAGGSFGGPGVFGGSAEDAATPEDRQALDEATRDRSKEAREDAAVSIDGQRVVPGEDGTFTAARTAANELPLPVLLALICIAALAAVAAFAAAGRRWPQIRRVALRLLRR
jgi:hypothetical protein